MYWRDPKKWCALENYMGATLEVTIWRDDKSFNASHWHRHAYLSKNFFSTPLLHLKWKASAHKQSYFPPRRESFIYILSHHSFFENFLESIAVILSLMCLSENKINCGITVMLESFDIFTYSLRLKFRGAPAFMFFSTNRASQIPLYHIILWILQSCTYLCLMFLIIVLVSFYSLHNYWVALVARFLLWVA